MSSLENYSSFPLQTRVMVTNSLTFVDKVDLIVVLDKGCISECGTFSELLTRQGPFTVFLQEHLRKKMERSGSDSGNEEDSDDTDEEVRCEYALLNSLTAGRCDGDIRIVYSIMIQWRMLQIYSAQLPLDDCHMGPILLRWFNFNPSMDK